MMKSATISFLNKRFHLLALLVSGVLVSADESVDKPVEETHRATTCTDARFIDRLGQCLPSNRSLVIDLYPSPSDSSDDSDKPQYWNGRIIDTQRWRLKYVDEQQGSAKLKLVERSIDARLANALYTVTSIRMFNVDAQTYNLGSDEENKQAMQQVAGPQVDDRRCGEQLADLLAQVRSLGSRLQAKRENSSKSLGLSESDIWLAQVLDSYGHYESGHLVGKAYAFGSMEECANSELLLAGSSEPEAPHYCWARLNLEKYEDAALHTRPRGQNEADKNVLQVGVCVPKSCHSASFQVVDGDKSSASPEAILRDENRRLLQQIVATQFKLPQSMYIEQELEISQVYCAIDEQSQFASLRPSGFKVFFAFVIVWFALMLYATWFRLGDKKSSRGLLGPLACLDLRESWAEFTFENEPSSCATEPQPRVVLDILNPAKIGLSYFVVFGHSLVVALGSAANQLAAYNLMDSDTILLSTTVSSVAVDTFFVMTGILFGYNEMQRAHSSSSQANGAAVEDEKRVDGALTFVELNSDNENKQSKSSARPFFSRWLRITAARHLRLVPLFWLVFWFKKSVFPYISPAEPLWDSGFNTKTSMGACLRESWFTPILARSAFIPLASQCLLQSWTISADLFYSFFIPPVLIIMPKRPKLAALLATLMIAVSTAWSYSAMSSVHPSLGEELLELRMLGYARMYADLSYLYTYPHYRFASILIGIFAGYFLFEYQRGERINQWPRWFTGPITRLVIALHLLLYLGVANLPKLKQLLAPYHRMGILHQMSTARVIGGLCNATIFIRLASDWNSNYIVRQFGKRIWAIMAKLNLALLLVHLDYLIFVSQSQVSNVYFSKMLIFNNTLATVAFSIPVCVLLHVAFENPMAKLTKRYVMPLIRL